MFSDKPILPECMEYLWEDFIELCKGCESVGYTDLKAYQEITGKDLNYWESSLLIELDLLRRKRD